MPSVAGRITVRERIDPRITSSLFSNYRSSADAIMELVDNSIDSRLLDHPLDVQMTLHGPSLTIMTAGGQGMGPRDLEFRYLRWGGSAKRGKEMLGQYGQGGKAAIGHLGRRFTVEATRPGDERAWRFADREYRDRSRLKTYELAEVTKRTPADQGYVRIRIDDIDKRIDLKRLIPRLTETYRPLLETGQLQMSINGSRLQPPEIPTTERREFRVRASGSTIEGWVGIVDAERRSGVFSPGMRCYKLGRLIHQEEFFGHPSPAQYAGLSRLVGEVEIRPVPLTMNKSDFDRDSPEWIRVEERLHRVLSPLVKRLVQEDEQPPPANALRVAEQVRRLLSQALKIADHEELFPGGAPSKPKPQDQTQPELQLEEQPPQSPAAPRVSKPSDRPRRGGFGDIVIRRLDPSIRSQTEIAGGVKLVVINSAYPLFIERKGDVWYQMETAAREICKSMEGVTVAEYERRVNEIMLLAFKLRQRRKRTPDRSVQLALA